MKLHFLPAVDTALKRPGLCISGWRVRIRHPAHHLHAVPVLADLEIRVHMHAGIAAYGLEVHIAQMAQIQQIVVNQLIRSVVVVDAAAKTMCGSLCTA
jgi:hypothetical protein